MRYTRARPHFDVPVQAEGDPLAVVGVHQHPASTNKVRHPLVTAKVLRDGMFSFADCHHSC